MLTLPAPTSPCSSTPRSAERGFTLLELLVGMVLIALVMGAVFMAITSMFSGASERATDRKNGAITANVLEQFERDVRAAESPDRLNAPVVRDEMRAIVLWGTSRSTTGTVSKVTGNNPCATPSERNLDYCVFEDITRSRDTELWFRADVDAANNGHECVAWYVAADRSLWRRVTADHRRCHPGNLGATISNDQMLQPPANNSVGNAQNRSASFGYLTRFNPDSFGTQAARYNSIVDPERCQSYTYPLNTDLNGIERGYITNVTLDLAAWTTGGDSLNAGASAARQRATTSATITSRANDDFAYSTGCGA